MKQELKSQAQRAAEADVDSFRKLLGPFVVAAEKTRMPLVFTDARTPDDFIVFANSSFLALTGYEQEDVLGESLLSLIGRGSAPEAASKLAAAFSDSLGREQEIEFFRKDGTKVWASAYISPVKNEQGEVVQHFVSLLDVSAHRQAHHDATLLIDELNHRVKNTLASVMSIVRLSFRKYADPETIREAIESRIFALSRSHDLLNRVQWKDAGLSDVVRTALEPFGINNGAALRFDLQGENIQVPPRITLALSVALHELATNAVKYGALSNDAGSIAIAWKREQRPDGGHLVIHWQEKNGPPVTQPSQKGFGSQVLERGIALELQAAVQLEYRREGVVCAFDIPFSGESDGG